jgi:hypothetical protein
MIGMERTPTPTAQVVLAWIVFAVAVVGTTKLMLLTMMS